MARRNKVAMKYWGFYITDELKAQTIECAKTANESDSEYIRWAIILRNQMQTGGNFIPKPIGTPMPHEPENNLVGIERLNAIEERVRNTPKPTIPELKQKVKEMESPKMVQSFMKGGK